jgi:transcriptional regulator with GAF, ATPase, and Fis domain
MLALLDELRQASRTDITVCIFGESGTGKELFARMLHHAGPRHAQPLVSLNCAAIAESLQASELFGHERGAFTGALGRHEGCFEQANGGTLFLDEIGEMTPAVQAALLRTLQERTIRRVGGTTEVPVDVRIVCATRRDLAAEVRAGSFREDLYYRIVVYPVRLPPLRDRCEDIPLLVDHVLQRYVDDLEVTQEAMDVLQQYTWPGNVRELFNVIECAVVRSKEGQITPMELPAEIRHGSVVSSPSIELFKTQTGYVFAEDAPILPLEDLERAAVEHALRIMGSIDKAAQQLGVGRSTLYRWIARRSPLR